MSEFQNNRSTICNDLPSLVHMAPLPSSAAPIWSPRILWLVPSLVTGLLPAPIINPVVTQIQQRWWAGPGHDCSAPEPDQACKDALAHASLAISVAAAVGAALGFFLAPVTGRLSDTYGRRPVFIMTAVCSLLCPASLFLNDQFGTSLYFYYASFVIYTMSPDIVGYLAYIADISSEEQRRHSFGVLVGAFSVCVCVGPFIGVRLAAPVNFIVALSLLAMNLIYNIFILPESLPVESRRPFDYAALNPFASLAILNRYKLFRWLAVIVGLSYCTLSGVLDVSQLYARARFGFTKEDNAMLSEIWGLCGIIVQFFLLPFLVRHSSSRRILLFGLVAQATAVFAQGLAPTKVFLLACSGVSAFGTLSFPSVSAIKSLNSSEDEQGTIQGALAGIQQLAGVVGPLLFGSLFTLGQGHSLPQLPYFVGGSLVAVAAMLTVCLPPGRDTKSADASEASDANADASYDKLGDVDSVANTRKISIVHSGLASNVQEQ